MNLDFEKSLTYIGKDTQWVNKLLAGSGIILAAFAVFILPIFVLILSNSATATILSFVLCFIFSVVLSFALAGYVAETANKRINYQNSILPDWNDFGRFIVTGLKYFVGYFLYCLPLIIASCIYFFLLAVTMSGYHIHSASHQAVPFILLTLLGALLLLFYILVIVFCPLMMCNFFKNLKILSFVDFKEAFSLVKDNAGNYFVLILLFIALSVMMQILCSVLAITVVGLILIPVAYFYTYLVMAEICAQFVLSAKDKE